VPKIVLQFSVLKRWDSRQAEVISQWFLGKKAFSIVTNVIRLILECDSRNVFMKNSKASLAVRQWRETLDKK
jgi:hypothetical protein